MTERRSTRARAAKEEAEAAAAAESAKEKEAKEAKATKATKETRETKETPSKPSKASKSAKPAAKSTAKSTPKPSLKRKQPHDATHDSTPGTPVAELAVQPVLPPLPTKLIDGQPLPTLPELQPPNPSPTDYQTIAQSGVLAAALQKSRAAWVSGSNFRTFCTKFVPPRLLKNRTELDNLMVEKQNEIKKNLRTVGTATLIVEPHTFSITFSASKEALRSAPKQKQVYGQWPQTQYPTYQSYNHTPTPQYSRPPPPPQPAQHKPPPPPKPVHKPPPPAPAPSSGPAPDPVIHMLAQRAGTDPQLKAVMKIVAAGQATKEQLEFFQGHINELTKILEKQKAQAKAPLPQPAPQALPAAQNRAPMAPPMQQPSPAQSLMLQQPPPQAPMQQQPPRQAPTHQPPPAQSSAQQPPPVHTPVHPPPPAQIPVHQPPPPQAPMQAPSHTVHQAPPQGSPKPPVQHAPAQQHINHIPQQQSPAPPKPSTQTPNTPSQAHGRPPQPQYNAHNSNQHNLSPYPPALGHPGRPAFRPLVLEFAEGNGDKFHLPSYSFLEWLPGGRAVKMSFLITKMKPTVKEDVPKSPAVPVTPSTPAPKQPVQNPAPTPNANGETAAVASGSVPGAAPGVVPNSVSTPAPTATPSNAPSTVPGSVPGTVPGTVPAAVPALVPAPVPGTIPEPATGAAPSNPSTPALATGTPVGPVSRPAQSSLVSTAPKPEDLDEKNEIKNIEFYQPVTVIIASHESEVLEALPRSVRPPDEVEKYMNEVFDMCKRADEVYLAFRLLKDKTAIEEKPARDGRSSTPMTPVAELPPPEKKRTMRHGSATPTAETMSEKKKISKAPRKSIAA